MEAKYFYFKNRFLVGLMTHFSWHLAEWLEIFTHACNMRTCREISWQSIDLEKWHASDEINEIFQYTRPP
jgi:hypothetical protein